MNSVRGTTGQLKGLAVVNIKGNTTYDRHHMGMVSPNDQSPCAFQKLHDTDAAHSLKIKDFSRNEYQG